jgi:hypothetical protein
MARTLAAVFENDVLRATFARGQRKDDVVAAHRAQRPMKEGVIVIGVAQETMRAFKAHKLPTRGTAVSFDSLDNGFLACADPARLQAIGDRLGPADVQAFFDRWTARLPAPLTARDHTAGYTHRLALQQVEVSLTQVFARPVQGRHFFEAVIRENLDLGRPDRVGLLVPHRKGIIHRIAGTHRYTVTSYGLRVAFFCAKLYLRILRPASPACAAVDDQLPRPLRVALDNLDAAIRRIHEEAELAA